MNDVVNEAAQILVPLLAAGANTAVEEASKEAGKKFTGAIAKVLGRIQKHLHPGANQSEVAAALQAGVDAGAITMADLKEIVGQSNHRAGHTQVNATGKRATIITDPVFNDPVTFN
jgi:hypothetical protein